MATEDHVNQEEPTACNTNIRGRWWFLTWNNYPTDWETILRNAQDGVAQLETAPETGMTLAVAEGNHETKKPKG